MVDEPMAVLAIILMALVAYATRLGGVLAMSLVTVTPRVEAFLRQLAASVLIAVVVPAAARGGPAAWLAVAAAGLVMVVSRNALAGMVVGVVAAAGLRLLIDPR